MTDRRASDPGVPEWYYNQAGVVPYRKGDDGRIEVLLVTSRRGRWIFPKGVIEPGQTDREAAEAEAWEEAGVRGTLTREPLGRYEYDKWGGTCRVTVFAMHIEQVLDEWPESHLRERGWFSRKEAEAAVGKRRLARMIRQACEQGE